MAILPNKLLSGQEFKSSAVRAINGIIDYLKGQKIVGDGRTIKVNQTLGGVQLSMIGDSTGSPNSEKFTYLFQLGIAQNANDETVLTVNSLRTHSATNHYIKQVSLANLTTDGTYRVKCMIRQYPPAEGMYDNGYTIYFTPSSYHTGEGNEPNIRGIFAFQLGTIIRTTTTVDEVTTTTYRVEYQDTVGHVWFPDWGPYTDFSVWVKLTREGFTDGALVDLFTFDDFSLYVCAGRIYKPNANVARITAHEFQLSQVTGVGHYYVFLQPSGSTWTFDLRTSSSIAQDEYLIAEIHDNPYLYAHDYWVLYQYISSSIILKGTGDDIYVACNSSGQPCDLADKLETTDASVTFT
jgi:hypothetical protein